jgi:hypothetical protein
MEGIAVVGTIVVILGLMAGCGSSRRDLNGVPNQDPQKAEMYANVDGYPNIVRICVDGVAFATTTRNYGDAIMRVPEWDASFCGK